MHDVTFTFYVQQHQKYEIFNSHNVFFHFTLNKLLISFYSSGMLARFSLKATRFVFSHLHIITFHTWNCHFKRLRTFFLSLLCTRNWNFSNVSVSGSIHSSPCLFILLNINAYCHRPTPLALTLFALYHHS